MRQPWWKKLLSHFIEIKIETVESRFSKVLEVIYSRDRYALRTENAIYSFEDLYHNFRESFYQIPLDNFPIQNVLILGLGLGSVPKMLENLFHKHYNYTCVEIDEQVIALAAKYGIAGLKSPIQTVCADAYVYVKETATQYDLIIVDLFIDDKVPSKFENIEFLKELNRLLNKEGLLMYNRMASSLESTEKTNSFFDSVFVKIFPNADFINVSGNKILLNVGNLKH